MDRLAASRRARAVLLWTTALVVASQLGLNLLLEGLRLDLFDPHWGRKLAELRARTAEVPDRPLWLALGSSLVATAFRPDIVEGDRPALFFNFSMLGASDPVAELVYLRRLLSRNVRPAGIILEVNPRGLGQANVWIDDMGEGSPRLSIADLPVVIRHLDRPFRVTFDFLGARLAPAFTYRLLFLRDAGLEWFGGPAHRLGDGRELDRWGYHAMAPLGTEQRWNLIEWQFPLYASALDSWQVAPSSDVALRDLLETCRRESIRVALLSMPESGGLQSLYGPGTRDRVEAYLREISARYSIPWIDARDWVPDEEFAEGIHVTGEGARIFTARLGRDVLPALARGALPPSTAFHSHRRPFPETEENRSARSEVRLEFDRPLPGYGWWRAPGSSAWTISTISTLNLWLQADHDYVLRFRIAQAMAHDVLDSLVVRVNGQPLALVREAEGGKRLCAVLPSGLVARDADLTRLTFHTNRTVTRASVGANQESRALGLRFDWLDVRRVSEGPRCAVAAPLIEGTEARLAPP